MPILKFGPNGEVMEGHRDLGENGLGNQASYVMDNDVTLLSKLEDPRVVKDRKAMKQLEASIKLNNFKKLKLNKAKKAHALHRQAKLKERAYLNAVRKDAYKNLMHSANKIRQISSGTNQSEFNSGVTGYGLTADGRQPVLSQASLDWEPVESVDKAFGSKEENFGSNMNMGETIDPKADYISIFDKPSITWTNPYTRKEETMNVKVATVADLGNLTSEDQFYIGLYQDNAYAAKTRMSPLHEWTTLPFNLTKKNQYENSNNQTYYVSNTTQVNVRQRGWKWSGYIEGNTFYLVKIPNIYGLLTVEEEKIAPGQFPSKVINRIFGRDPANGGPNASTFKMLTPVTKAYAKQFLYTATSGGVAYKPTQFEYEAAIINKGEFTEPVNKVLPADVTKISAPSIFDKVRSFFTKPVSTSTTTVPGEGESSTGVGVSYAHPMKKQGLLK